jgi:hypothetical protein
MEKKLHLRNPVQTSIGFHIANTARLRLPMAMRGIFRGTPGAVICGTADTLLHEETLTRIRALVAEGCPVIAVKAGIRLLREQGIRVDYGCNMDPTWHEAAKTPVFEDVRYFAASSSHPAFLSHLLGHDAKVLIYHNFTGFPGEFQLYADWFSDFWFVQGGYTVVNRACSLAFELGAPKVFVAGAQFGWREGQGYYPPGIDYKAGNSGPVLSDRKGLIDGRPWHTKLDLLGSAEHVAALVRAGRAEVIGDSVAAGLAKHPPEWVRQHIIRPPEAA